MMNTTLKGKPDAGNPHAATARISAWGIVALLLTGGGALAETFTLSQAPTTLAEWKSADFYTGETAPTGASTDVINIPCGVTVTVNDTQTDVIAFLNGIQNVYVDGTSDKAAPQGKLVFDVAENATLEFSGSVDCESRWNVRHNRVEKTGKGALKLLNVGLNAANANWYVIAGELWLPPPDLSYYYDQYRQYGLVYVGPNGTIRTDSFVGSYTDTVRGTTHSHYWQMSGLYNDGRIVNGAATEHTSGFKVCYNRIDPPEAATCQGSFSTGLNITVLSGDFPMLGDANEFTSYPSVNGDEAKHPARLLAHSFGTSGATSSIGENGVAALINGTLGGALVYAGTGETSSKNLLFIAGDKTTVAWSEINGGACGGLTLTGSFTYWGSSVGWIPHVIFGGDHANRCTFSGTLADFATSVYDGTSRTYARYLKKTGTGEWYFPENAKFTTGATIEVADGTWAFDSIADRGYNSSLGTASRTYDVDAIQPFDANRVGYAFVLGSTNGTEAGMLECRAATVQQCTDRPFVLRGRGGFRASTAAVRFADVSAIGGGAKTLVLDGSLATESEVHDVSNGVGTVSVEKRGTGTWVLGGDLTFSGTLNVQGGTLIVRRPSKTFSRYRLLVKEIIDNNSALLEKRGDANTNSTKSVELTIAEIGLWAADNSRQNMNLAYNASYKRLQPGEFAFGGERTSTINTSIASLLFDGCRYTSTESSYGKVWHPFLGEFSKNGEKQQSPQLNNPDSWIPIDMYLAAGSKPIDHFDVLCSEENNSRRAASAFQLLASADGIHWESVSAENCMLQNAGAIRYNWLSDNKYSDLKDNGLPPYDPTSSDFNHAGGWKTTKTESALSFSMLEDVGAVTVANGATLKFEGADAPALDALRLDATTGGTIDGFAFASAGTLDVTGAAGEKYFDLPVSFTHSDTLQNLRNWTVNVAGSETRKYRLIVSGNRVRVDSRTGFIISIQ